MTGTTDLSNAQFAKLRELVETYTHVSRIVLTPITRRPGQAVRATLHISAYGTLWFIIERDGAVSSAEDVSV
jgi:hypothetical protein